MIDLMTVKNGLEDAGEGGALPVPSSVTLTLPVPPSVNKMFKNIYSKRGGRADSKAYVDWKGHASWMLRSQHPPHIDGRVLAVVSVERGNAHADIDNRIKALFDVIVREGVIDDDSLITGFCVAWAPKADLLARIMLVPVGTYDFTFHPAADGATGGWFLNAPPPEQEVA